MVLSFCLTFGHFLGSKYGSAVVERRRQIYLADHDTTGATTGEVQQVVDRQLICYPQEVIPTLDMEVNELFNIQYPATILPYQIQVIKKDIE